MGDELQPGEVLSLARKMAGAYAEMVRYYKKQYGITSAEADQKAQELMAMSADDYALKAPIDQLGWWSLNELARRDPDKAAAAWARVKAEARAELATGVRLANAAEGYGAGPWARAQVLAIRESMMAEWRPQGGIEAALVETLASAYSGYLLWLERLVSRCTTDAQMEQADLNSEGKWRPTRIGQAAATEEAAAMMDRFNRIFLRTLRALRDLRRYAAPVHIENAAQVNIGEQQVNLSTTSTMQKGGNEQENLKGA